MPAGAAGRVSVADKAYDALGYDPADVTRAVRYTRYVDDTRMRGTAVRPAALRQLAAKATVSRRCTARLPGHLLPAGCDRLAAHRHPQQLDLWRISRRNLTARRP